MPELPEVETICQGIAPQIEACKISKVKVNCQKLRIPVPKKFASILKGREIIKVKRKAKYIVIELDSAYNLVIHLGMSGRLIIHDQTSDYQAAKHDHIIIELDKGSVIVFNDSRKFGLATVLHETEFDDFKFFKKLGLEPLSEEFGPAKFYKILQKRKKNIKSVIMDSSIVVGIGNIYASESLFSAGIHPERLASEISEQESKKLHRAIIKTLKRAIAAGGSTLKDYAKANGESGYFQHQFLVYDQKDKACSKCSRPIQKIKQNARATYYCATCQN